MLFVVPCHYLQAFPALYCHRPRLSSGSQILYEIYLEDSGLGRAQDRKLTFIEHCFMPDTAQIHTLIQSFCELDIIPISHIKNPFSDNVGCPLNFSVELTSRHLPLSSLL